MHKKELIKKSAIEVFAKEGYHNTTTRMLSNHANIAIGTIYNYFNSKQDILDYIFKIEFESRVKLLTELKQQDIPSRKKLQIFLDKHFESLEFCPDTAAVLVQEAWSRENSDLESIKKFAYDLPKVFAEIIEQGILNNEFRKVSSDLISYSIFYAIRGVATKVVNNDKYSFNEAKKEIFNFLWNGLKNY